MALALFRFLSFFVSVSILTAIVEQVARFSDGTTSEALGRLGVGRGGNDGWIVDRCWIGGYMAHFGRCCFGRRRTSLGIDLHPDGKILKFGFGNFSGSRTLADIR